MDLLFTGKASLNLFCCRCNMHDMMRPPKKMPRTTIGISRFFVASASLVHLPPPELADEGNADEGAGAATNSTDVLGMYYLF